MFAIATTDLDWFFGLRAGATGRVVNFWTPTPWHVKGLHPGDRLYFMLKAPIRKIGGFGFFVRYSDMTAEKAWTTYGLGNGVPSREALVSKINWFATKRSKGYTPSSDPHIGWERRRRARKRSDGRLCRNRDQSRQQARAGRGRRAGPLSAVPRWRLLSPCRLVLFRSPSRHALGARAGVKAAAVHQTRIYVRQGWGRSDPPREGDPCGNLPLICRGPAKILIDLQRAGRRGPRTACAPIHTLGGKGRRTHADRHRYPQGAFEVTAAHLSPN